jgi:hypothetical protein
MSYAEPMTLVHANIDQEQAVAVDSTKLFSLTLIVFLGASLAYEIIGWYEAFSFGGQSLKAFDPLFLLTPFLFYRTLREGLIHSTLVKYFLIMMMLSIVINFVRADVRQFTTAINDLRLQWFNFSGVLLGCLTMNLPKQATNRIFAFFIFIYLTLFVLRITVSYDFLSDPQFYFGKFHDGRYASFVGTTTLSFLTFALLLRLDSGSSLLTKNLTVIAAIAATTLVFFSFQRTATVMYLGAAVTAFVFRRSIVNNFIIVIFGTAVLAILFEAGLFDTALEAFLKAGVGGEKTLEFRQMVWTSFYHLYQSWDWTWKLFGQPFGHIYDLQLQNGQVFQATLHNGFAGIQKAYGAPLSYFFVCSFLYIIINLLNRTKSASDKTDYAIAFLAATSVVISTNSYEYRDILTFMIGIVLGQYNNSMGASKPVES